MSPPTGEREGARALLERRGGKGLSGKGGVSDAKIPDEVLTAEQRRRIDEHWPSYMGLLAALIPDTHEHQQVRFRGQVYLLIGDMENGGAIATKEQYESGAVSYAHLMSDGRILRFMEQIGTLADLEFWPRPVPLPSESK